MTKWTCALIPLLISASALLPYEQPAHAETRQVDVALPSFPIRLNNKAIDIDSSEYPPIVYNDMAYVPLTWNNGLRLQLSVSWESEDGLTIQNAPEVRIYSLYEEPSPVPNDIQQTYQASVAAYPITVNGRKLDNETEPYPILSFRSMTYFPLTWQFAREFQWLTAWSAQDGLSVVSDSRGHLLGGISGFDGQSLYVTTSDYGTFQLDKTLKKDPIPLTETAYEHLKPVISSPKSNKRLATTLPESNETRLDGDRIVWGDIELTSLQASLEDANSRNYGRTFAAADIKLIDTVFSLGSDTLITVYTSLPTARTRSFLVRDNHAVLLDYVPLYSWLANPDGTYWITTAIDYHEPHHISWLEYHVWLLDRDGKPLSVHDVLGHEQARILTTLPDGTAIVLASEYGEQTGYIYRVGTDGKAVKLYRSVEGTLYADQTGEVYALHSETNKITKLSTGDSIVLSEKSLFLAAGWRTN